MLEINSRLTISVSDDESRSESLKSRKVSLILPSMTQEDEATLCSPSHTSSPPLVKSLRRPLVGGRFPFKRRPATPYRPKKSKENGHLAFSEPKISQFEHSRPTDHDDASAHSTVGWSKDTLEIIDMDSPTIIPPRETTPPRNRVTPPRIVTESPFSFDTQEQNNKSLPSPQASLIMVSRGGPGSFLQSHKDPKTLDFSTTNFSLSSLSLRRKSFSETEPPPPPPSLPSPSLSIRSVLSEESSSPIPTSLSPVVTPVALHFENEEDPASPIPSSGVCNSPFSDASFSPFSHSERLSPFSRPSPPPPIDSSAALRPFGKRRTKAKLGGAADFSQSQQQSSGNEKTSAKVKIVAQSPRGRNKLGSHEQLLSHELGHISLSDPKLSGPHKPDSGQAPPPFRRRSLGGSSRSTTPPPPTPVSLQHTPPSSPPPSPPHPWTPPATAVNNFDRFGRTVATPPTPPEGDHYFSDFDTDDSCSL